MSNQLTIPPFKSSNDRLVWANLYGSALPYVVSEAARLHASSSLVITRNMSEAERIYRDLNLFKRNQKDAPEVILFADWETLSYDTFSPHQDIISERMRCLYNLAQEKKILVIVSAQTIAQRLVPAEYILSKSLAVKIGEKIQRQKFVNQLAFAGYNAVDTVFQHGEFAIRGGLIDVFPMGCDNAFRIELFDDEIDSLREFDTETQRTIRQVDTIEVLPGRECPIDEESISLFKHQWHERFNVDHKNCPVYVDIISGLSPAGVEYFLPLFFTATSTLFDYLPDDSQIFIVDGFESAYEEFWRDTQNRYTSRAGDIERPILKPQEILLPVNEVFSALKNYRRVQLVRHSAEVKAGHHLLPFATTPELLVDSRANEPLKSIEKFLYESSQRILFCAETNGRREALKEQLSKIKISPDSFTSIEAFINSNIHVGITVADIDEGLNCSDPAICLIAESQLFGTHVKQARRRKSGSDDHESIIKNLTELKIRAPVVHIEHGVGRYLGLQTIEHNNIAEEFLVLEYANEAKLYVPVANLHMISRYSGSNESHAPLNKLGSDQWQKAKRKAAEQIRDVAAELLDIYAKRKAKSGFAYHHPKDDYELFCTSFPFEETPDQVHAIQAVRDDMLSAQPMDRLVCGDVGFGKTEVAMRAAFIAIQNSKQVAVLVPTTLLAQQHYENFKDRFADWPANIEVVSRFKSAKEIASVQTNLERGKVDIIIGTHKLIQSDIKFSNLGLLIIDEEHRFGVRQKEVLKSLRSDIDILTMTATPIPRTLNMSMSGIRDLSIIATPPAKRLSVKTFVKQADDAVTKEAILRELMRGGQIYYLHNEVKTIDRVAAELTEQIPEARIRIGHGQMRERELEAVMSDFYHKRFNILVCTTIIETGIDVPSANTIIIDRADKFGLAQLHQLRGRVGRSHHQAYAYLLTPHKKVMTPDAVKRLEAIQEAQDLGAGFMLASHDLEIRGAGELLGEDQSGQIQTIGFTLYMDMLDRAVKAIQNGEAIDLETHAEESVEINLRIPALIPDSYLPDINSRLTIYKRIASTKNSDQLRELQIEMIDRFGLLPEATKNLIEQTLLRFEAEALGIKKVEAGPTQGKLEFDSNTKVDPLAIVKLVQSQPQSYRLDGANHLKFIFDMEDAKSRLETITHVFNKLRKTS